MPLMVILQAGAKKVIISAPAKGDVRTIVLGVNDEELKADDAMLYPMHLVQPIVWLRW